MKPMMLKNLLNEEETRQIFSARALAFSSDSSKNVESIYAINLKIIAAVNEARKQPPQEVTY